MPSEPGPSVDRGCLDAVRRLYTYLDGELDEARRSALKRHLDECMPCLQAFDFEAELRMLIARKCREQVPVTLWTRISEVARQEVGTSAWQRTPRRRF